MKSFEIFLVVFLLIKVSAAQYQIKSSIISNGAGHISGANHSIKSTLGQPAIGIMNNNDHSINSGFWYFGDFYVSIPENLENIIPQRFELFQNFPNPFNPVTTIRYTLPKAGDVKIDIYNILGEHVATIVNGHYAIGLHEVKYDAQHLSTGYYIYRIRAGDFIQVKRMLLTK